MLNKKKNEESKKIESQIVIKDFGETTSVHIEGNSLQLANLLAYVFCKHDGFFRTVKMAVEAWEETKKMKDLSLDSQIDKLVEKLEELKNITGKIH